MTATLVDERIALLAQPRSGIHSGASLRSGLFPLAGTGLSLGALTEVTIGSHQPSGAMAVTLTRTLIAPTDSSMTVPSHFVDMLIRVLLVWLCQVTLVVQASSPLPSALERGRNGDYRYAYETFSNAPDTCIADFDDPRDQSDCLVYHALFTSGITAFCGNSLFAAQDLFSNLLRAREADRKNPLPMAALIDVVVEAELQFPGGAMLVHESVDSPEAVAAGLLRELTASDAELGALFTARSAQAFAEPTALALYQHLAPYGAVAGKQPDSRFVAENFNALYGLFLLQRGDERAALPLAERQRRLAPEHVTTLDLLMRALHLNGKRVAAEATRQRALDLYPDCDRFKFPLDNGSM